MSEFLNELKQIEANQFQEELAKTYFSTPASKEKCSSQSQPRPENKGGRNKNSLLLVIFSALLIVTAAALMLFNRMSININISPANVPPANDTALSEGIHFNKNGELNSEVVKNAVFYENAGRESGWGREMIVVSNEIISKKAVLGIDLAGPVDISEWPLSLLVRGKRGGEEFRIVLRDDANNTCYSKTVEAGDDWQRFVIDGPAAREFIDTGRVNHIDLEVNPAQKDFLDSSTVYFKDIYLSKQEGGMGK